MTVYKALLVAVTVILSACAAVQTPLDEGYQFGDTTGSVLLLQQRYCESADPRSRAVTLALMYRAGIELPPEGACTDILEVLNGDIHTRAPKD